MATAGVLGGLFLVTGPSTALANVAVDAERLDSTAASDSTAVVSGVEAVARHLEGVMSTAAQASRDADFVGVQMTTCRVTPSDPQPNSIYLYQEQALIGRLSAPYRQRFLQITPGNNQRIESRTFKPDRPAQWVGLCAQPEPVVAITGLGESVCTVSLRASVVGGYVGSTPSIGCPANVRGAVSITNVVVLHENGMDTWDRGFDAEGNQVWGADTVPYQYRR